MVCLGNICRSPMAEVILRKKAQNAGLDWTVHSAGTESFHVGESAHRYTIETCLHNGLEEIEQHVARQLRPQDFEEYDLLYALATDVREEMEVFAPEAQAKQKIVLLLDEQYPNKNYSVTDPYYGSKAGYGEVYRVLDAVCEVVVRKYANGSPKSHA